MKNSKNLEARKIFLEKARFFAKRKVMIHIILKNSRKFYNGEIIGIDELEDFILINDRKAKEIPILINEIHKMEVYENK
jgi:hypothetical protein